MFVFGHASLGRAQARVDSVSVGSAADSTKANDSVQNLKKDSLSSAINDSNSVKKPAKVHFVRIGFDVSRLVFNNVYKGETGYEFAADYNWKDNLELAGEVGFGTGRVNKDILKYRTNGTFFRFGIEQTLFGKIDENDFDNVFIGLRYAMGFGKMGDAEYVVNSQFGSPFEGTVAGKGYVVAWAELVAGIKVYLFKNIYAGWTIRGKFMFNHGTFKQLSPNYIPGFGSGDKNSVFDFNFYLYYGLKWRK